MSDENLPRPIELKLPATSANLGPGFDALGLALSIYLTIRARLSKAGCFEIRATGRDRELCGSTDRNLILDTYSDVLKRAGKAVLPLMLTLHNEIPLGMGCGSSAAALLAGVLLANHFGSIGMTGHEAMEEACRREEHPDNVAACWLGWMTTAAMTCAAVTCGDKQVSVTTATCGRNSKWRFLLAVPDVSLETRSARALLPEFYSRADAVTNVQNTALLVAAFALQRGGLLKTAMNDRMHQPYRINCCPLLPVLLQLSGKSGVLGVSLSGAGPSVLMIVEPEKIGEARAAVEKTFRDAELSGTELIEADSSKGSRIKLLR